jgi:hypothetical protein
MPRKFDINRESPSFLNTPAKNNLEPRILSPNKTFFIIFVISLAAIILGFLRLGNVIKSPFALNSSSSSNQSLLNENQIVALASLQNKDTDSDGLSDYDELYKYNTSPYLKDSDSDGYSDKEEIESGNDPNCPSGKDCTGQAASTTNTSINSNTNSNLNISVSNINSSILTGNISASELRETLKNAGAPEDVLNNTDDATLLQVYQDTLKEQTANSNINSQLSNLNTNTAATANTNTLATTVADLQNLSASEIRSLLKAYGVDDETINTVDDATLKTIFLEAINETTTE